MKSNNSTGIIIIVGIIMIAAMQTFNIDFNIENIKKVGSIWIGIVIAILIFLGMQSKKSSNPEHYIDPELEENKYNTQANNQNIGYQNTEVTENEDNRYNNNNYNQNNNYSPNPPQVNQTYTTPEEDNRWS